MLRLTAILAVALLTCSALASAQSPAPAPDASYSASFAKDTRTFELRTYYANPGKLEALNARFREHTNALFEKHGMTLVAYWMPVTPPSEGSGGTLIYVLAYPSIVAREAAWKAFGADPEWASVRDASEKSGKLVAKVDSVVMKATDYSPMR